jgi:hypothetical protein
MNGKNNYQLIALDMDGTLLNSRKQVSEGTLREIRKAVSLGKTVVYATGRAVCEMEEFFEQLPEIRYAVFASGAGLYDVQERRAFGLQPIPADLAMRVMDAVQDRDIMPQIVLADCDAVQRDQMDRLEDFRMKPYRPMYERAMTRVEDIRAFAEKHQGEILKMNVYHTNPEDRLRTKERLADLELEKVFSEVTSLECSAKGVDKGTGLAALCGYLRLDLERCIAVGDAPNDLPMIRTAGLGVAMGNSKPEVLEASDVVVSDNDHDGCAEAIRLMYE